MKKASKFTALMLAVITAFSMPFSAYAFKGTTIFNSKTYTHQDRFSGIPIVQGIDVSKHNGNINWAKVKAAGVKYAIIRVGYRGYGDSGKLVYDSKFNEYINAAYAQGLDIGIYFYSQAVNTREATEEANYALKKINSYKSKITLPVYYDYEFADVSTGRLDTAWRTGKLNKNGMTANAKAFCSTIENAGFDAGIYASKYFYYDNLNYEDLQDKYDIWVANYATKTTYKGTFRIWQFSSEGKVNGITGNVDANFLYKTYTVDIEKQAYTGKEIKPYIPLKSGSTELIKGEDYYVTFANNINYGTASVTVTGVNKYADIPKKTYYFEIVPTAVTGVTLTKRSAGSITLKWDEHPAAEGYQIKYYTANGGCVAGETTDTSYTVTGLAGSNWYYFTVSAVKSVSGKKYYGIESEKQRLITKPDKVTGIRTASRKKNSAVIKWNAQPNASHYKVFKYNPNAKKYELVGITNTNSINVKHIATNSKFKIKVRGAVITERGKEVWGANSKAYNDYSSPATPKIKSAKKAADKMITAKWKGVSNIKGYQIQYAQSATFTVKKKKVNTTNSNSLTFKAKGGGSSYYVRVRAYTKHYGKTYYSDWSKAIHVYM